MEYKVQDKCRICSGEVKDVFSLGEIYPSAFVDKTEGKPVPLTLVECEDCGLVQLKYEVDLDSMYRNYYYQSGINSSMVDSLQDIVNDVENTIELKTDDIILDIGCNDGTMLSLYRDKSLVKVGFDPAFNLHDAATKNCNFFFNSYFTADSYLKMFEKKAKVVTAIAMFYDLPDPNKFVKDITKVLDTDGILVIQFTDLVSMLSINAVDNICHEHLEYYRLEDVMYLLKKYGLSVFRVTKNSVNGGSIRIFASWDTKYPLEDNVHTELKNEGDYISQFRHPMLAFGERVGNIKRDILDFLVRCENSGINVYGYGASTKGNTLLQYFGINKRLIKKIAEVNKDKFGKVTIGTEIPIIPEEDALDEYPDIFFVLPWHFIDNIIGKNLNFLKDGGAFVVPMPMPTLYYYEEGGIKWASLKKVLL